MPKIVMNYKPDRRLTSGMLGAIGEGVRETFISFLFEKTGKQLLETDIEWYPVSHPPGALAPDVTLEIEMVAYPERVLALTEDAMKEFRKRLEEVDLVFDPVARMDESYIWVKYFLVEGPHV